MFEHISVWWFFGGYTALVFAFVYFWTKGTYRALEAYRDSVKSVLAPDVYNEEIVDWHFYEDNSECRAADECREIWGLGRN